MALNIQPIPGTAGRSWNGIATSCHFATLYNIHRAEISTLRTQNDFLNAFPNPTGLMSGMSTLGRRLTNPIFSNINLSPGSVIIFVKDGRALHSGVARNHNTIAGYNQVNWFTSVGVNHGHSIHDVADLKWIGKTKREVEGNADRTSPCQLIIVPENTARAYVRHRVT